MTRYAAIFAFAYLVVTLFLAMVSELLQLRIGMTFNFVAILLAGCIAGWCFTGANGRAPDRREKTSFAWRALIGAWLTSLLLVATYLTIAIPQVELQSIARLPGGSPAVTMAGMLLISVFYYFVIRWSFSWYANRAAGAKVASDFVG